MADSPSPPTTRSDRLHTGMRIGQYKIVRVLGEGGMGAVYEAVHEQLQKRVAIKTLLPQHAQNEDIRRRFVREGEAAAKLDHPNVVDVSDVGLDHGMPYLVMEFLQGEDLGAYLDRLKKLSLQQLADIMVPVCSALGAAHDAGIVHRDLKPDNIFLCRDRSGVLLPKVVDFGISKVQTTDDPLNATGTGALLGTPSYMSPEQAQGLKTLDARTDQFALGIIMYECVTGQRPFVSESLYGMLHAITNSIPPPATSVASELPPAIDQLLDRALAKDPAQRFASVRDIGRVLLPLASDRVRLNYQDELNATDVTLADGQSLSPPARTNTTLSSMASSRSSQLDAPRRAWLPWAGGAVAIAAVVSVIVVTRGSTDSAATPASAPIEHNVVQPATVPAPAVPASQMFMIVARPGNATIALDGRDVGTGDARVLAAPGVHRIDVSAPGHASQSVTWDGNSMPAPITLAPIAEPPAALDVAPPVVSGPASKRASHKRVPPASGSASAASTTVSSTTAPSDQAARPATEQGPRRGANGSLIVR